MANPQHIRLLKQGINAWRAWATKNPGTTADLSKADLRSIQLPGIDLRGANLEQALLSEANLQEADLSKAILRRADLSAADLRHANLKEADVSQANLTDARLRGANLERANLTGSTVFGVSAWELNLEGAVQTNLVITPPGQPTITVDSLEVAQFFYLLLSNQKVRDVVSSITTKIVLILGRFTAERKELLDAIRDELREHNYIPVVFDFEKPATRDSLETMLTLARISRFIIADLTDPKGIPQELADVVPTLPSVPVQPLLKTDEGELGMFDHLVRYPWVLPVYRYNSSEELLSGIEQNILAPAEAKAKEFEAFGS